MKRCLKLLNIRVMPIKTTMRYHLTLVWTAIVKKSASNKAGEGVEKREHSCTVGRNVNWYSHYGRWYGDSLKTKQTNKKTWSKTTIWSSNPTPGIYAEETKIEKDTCIPLFVAALLTIARTWKQPRCQATDEWIKKSWYIYKVEYYSAIKRNTFESVLMR